MSGRMAPAWFAWCEARLSTIDDRLENIERTLATFKTQQRRMRYLIIGVLIINGVLLFFK